MKNKNVAREFIGLPTSFFDLLFGLILVFSAIAILALMLINPVAKKEDVSTKAEIIIQMEWPMGDVDVDIWILTPTGAKMHYNKKEVGMVSLERDDTGNVKDTMIINGKEYINKTNNELITFRGIFPGTYVINIHLYRYGGYHNEYQKVPSVPVTIIMTKINPKVEKFYINTTNLDFTKQEMHIVRFNVLPDGRVEDVITDDPEPIISIQSFMLSDEIPTTPVAPMTPSTGPEG